MITKSNEEKNILYYLAQPSFLMDKPYEEVTSTELLTAIRDMREKMCGLNLLLNKLSVPPSQDSEY